MTDISMCNNTECPIKGKCYRYMAKPNDYQWYAMFEYINNECNGYIKYFTEEDKIAARKEMSRMLVERKDNYYEYYEN